jgi:hypothetical protein
MKKLFLHFLDLSVLNASLLHKPCGEEREPLVVYSTTNPRTCSECGYVHCCSAERKIKFTCHPGVPSGSRVVTGLSKEPKGGVSSVAWEKRYQSANTFARGELWHFVCFEDNHMKTSIQKPATVMSDEPL